MCVCQSSVLTGQAPTRGYKMTVVSDLPRAIQRAIARASSCGKVSGELQPLSGVAQLVLVHLVRCADAVQHHLAIRVRKQVIADAIGVTSRTVFRSLVSLEDNGWIRRKEQAITRREGAQIGEVCFTSEAIEFLFANLGKTASPDHSARPHQSEGKGRAADLEQLQAKMSHACRYSKEAKASSSIGHPAAPTSFGEASSSHEALVEPASSATAKTVHANDGDIEPLSDESIAYQTQAVALPSDVKPLLARGLSPVTIFWLMGEATKANKRLGEIVLVTQHLFAKVRDIKRYLLTLIHGPTNFTARIRFAERKAEEAATLKSKQEQLARFLQEQVGQFIDDSTDNLLVREGDHFQVTRPDGSTYSTPAPKVYAAVNSGKAKLRTLSDEEYTCVASERKLLPRTPVAPVRPRESLTASMNELLRNFRMRAFA